LLGADAAEDDAAADAVADADPEDAGPEIVEGDGVEIMADMVDGSTSEPAE
jgi:hypothetical protein